jgi:hypothetical protein
MSIQSVGASTSQYAPAVQTAFGNEVVQAGVAGIEQHMDSPTHEQPAFTGQPKISQGCKRYQ